MGTLDVVSLVFSIVGFSGSFSWYGEETCMTGRICHQVEDGKTGLSFTGIFHNMSG